MHIEKFATEESNTIRTGGYRLLNLLNATRIGKHRNALVFIAERAMCQLLLLIAQAVIMVLEVPYWVVWECLMCVAMIALNFKMLWTGLMRLFKKAGV